VHGGTGDGARAAPGQELPLRRRGGGQHATCLRRHALRQKALRRAAAGGARRTPASRRRRGGRAFPTLAVTALPGALSWRLLPGRSPVTLPCGGRRRQEAASGRAWRGCLQAHGRAVAHAGQTATRTWVALRDLPRGRISFFSVCWHAGYPSLSTRSACGWRGTLEDAWQGAAGREGFPSARTFRAGGFFALLPLLHSIHLPEDGYAALCLSMPLRRPRAGDGRRAETCTLFSAPRRCTAPSAG